MSGGTIEIRGLTKRFRVDGATLTALGGIDLAAAPGEFLTIVGASGCGKSTLLRLIAGLDRADEGVLSHDGRPISGPALNRGLVFQEPRLFPWLTVAQNVGVALENARMSRPAKMRTVDEHLALVGLSAFARAWPHQLSGGMAQRAAIARGLANRPDVLLLDEPFGALDMLTRARLQDELRAIQARQRATMILVTHDVDEAIYLGDRVVVLAPRPGRIREILDVPLPAIRDRADPRLAAMRARVVSALGDGAAPDRAPLHPAIEAEAYRPAAFSAATAIQ